jgi:hypothetical protein
MIYDLYVVSKKNGICIYHKGFGTTLVNSDLVAGLLTAMFSFMKEVRGDDIRIMVSGTSKFVFKESPTMIFAGLVDAAHDEAITSGFLEDVKNAFAEHDMDKFPNSTICEDDPISQKISQLLYAPVKTQGAVRMRIRLGQRLTKLVASELTTQKDALTNLFNKVVENKGHLADDSELQTKYKREIENLNRLIKESER